MRGKAFGIQKIADRRKEEKRRGCVPDIIGEGSTLGKNLLGKEKSKVDMMSLCR